IGEPDEFAGSGIGRGEAGEAGGPTGHPPRGDGKGGKQLGAGPSRRRGNRRTAGGVRITEGPRRHGGTEGAQRGCVLCTSLNAKTSDSVVLLRIERRTRTHTDRHGLT